MITVQPLETSVRDLAPDTLVYVIRGGWALAYRAEMLDDCANELYVASGWPALERPTAHPEIMWCQFGPIQAANARRACAADLPHCAEYTLDEYEFRERYGLPVDTVQHPR